MSRIHFRIADLRLQVGVDRMGHSARVRMHLIAMHILVHHIVKGDSWLRGCHRILLLLHILLLMHRREVHVTILIAGGGHWCGMRSRSS